MKLSKAEAAAVRAAAGPPPALGVAVELSDTDRATLWRMYAAYQDEVRARTWRLSEKAVTLAGARRLLRRIIAAGRPCPHVTDPELRRQLEEGHEACKQCGTDPYGD